MSAMHMPMQPGNMQHAAMAMYHHNMMMEAAMVHAAHNGLPFPGGHMAHGHGPAPQHGHQGPHRGGNHHSGRRGMQHQRQHQQSPGFPLPMDASPTPVKATPSRHLNYSMDSPVPDLEHGGTTLPHPSRDGQDETTGPHYGRRLERELQQGTKEELVKLLLELCNTKPEISQFIECKAQLFSLRTSAGNSPVSEGHGSFIEQTPFTNMVTPMKPGSTVESLADHPSTVTKTPASPMEELTHDLTERRQPPEEREFCEDKHPCLRMYTNCRYPTSCLYRELPRNLCLNFLRNDCTVKDCPLVHRIPDDASPPVMHMVAVCRGAPVEVESAPPAQRELFNASNSDVADTEEPTEAKPSEE